MWEALKGALKGLVGSKKFIAAFLSAATWGVGKLGLQLDPTELYPLVLPLWGYILAQAGADWGKAAKELAAKDEDKPE